MSEEWLAGHLEVSVDQLLRMEAGELRIGFEQLLRAAMPWMSLNVISTWVSGEVIPTRVHHRNPGSGMSIAGSRLICFPTRARFWRSRGE